MLHYIIGISILTLGIIIIRALSNGKILRKHQYAFWIVIPLFMMLSPFIRFNIPVSVDWNTLFSAKAETTSDNLSEDVAPYVQDNKDIIEESYSVNQPIAGGSEETVKITNEYSQVQNYNIAISGNAVKKRLDISLFLKQLNIYVSATLIVSLMVYNAGFVVYCKRKREYVRKDLTSGLKIYRIKNKGTPFLLFNGIYVDADSKDISEYIICHEVCHYKHGDYIWVLIRYLVLFLNWYNPILWIAFILSGQDCELACDEEVLNVYGADFSKDYARALLGMLQQQTNTATIFTLSTGMRDGYKTMKKRIINIKKPSNKSRKALAMSLAAIILFTSCSFVDTPEQNRKVSADSPWYNSQVFDVDMGLKPDREIYVPNMFFWGSDNKYFVVGSEGSYVELPNDATSFEYFENAIIVDRNTKEVVNTIDLGKIVDNNGYDHVINDGTFYANGILTVKTPSKELDFDPLTGDILATRDITTKDIGFDSKFYKVGEYTIEAARLWDDNNHNICNMIITSPDGNSSEVVLKEIDNDVTVVAILEIDNTTALIPAYTRKGNKFYKLDLLTNTFTTEKAEDYSWLDPNKLYDSLVGSDGMVYCRTDSGLSRINISVKAVEEVFAYNWCGINSAKLKRLQFVECSEESIILLGQTQLYSSNKNAPKEFQIIELTKAEKNPNAGKTILELYAHGMDDNISEAISIFNMNNKDYFIEVVTRYDESIYNSDPSQMSNMDDREIETIQKNKNISNDIAMDIINGKGPDILINTSNYGQLNNPDYLVDLSPYVKDLDSNKYYTNIIEGSRIDGVLYQLPVSFIIRGIYTDEKEAGSSGVGFTLDEYQSFVDGYLNGTDIIFSGQAVRFAKLFGSMDDIFITNGKADFTKPEFAELADYVKNNVPEQGLEYGESFPTSVYEAQRYAQFTGTQGFCDFYEKNSYLSGTIKNPTILGIPSIDGRGPMFSAMSSVAISKNAVNVEACGEFVKILLSDDIQNYMAMSDQFVLNRNAFRNAGEKAIESINNAGGFNPTNKVVLTTNEIDRVENVILSCSWIDSVNSSVSIILIEEMPAYFIGQKDLDSVIKIAQDRVQKVLDERG